MAKYIEREAALRVLCDACGNAACPKGLIPQCSYYEKMQSIPAADVRPVVLCKDCQYWKQWDNTSHSLCTYVLGASFVRKADDFCSRGEKREES